MAYSECYCDCFANMSVGDSQRTKASIYSDNQSSLSSSCSGGCEASVPADGEQLLLQLSGLGVQGRQRVVVAVQDRDDLGRRTAAVDGIHDGSRAVVGRQTRPSTPT